VTDLLERLTATVGETYRIEQELGGGGMSRVFLAEELRLGRPVVIKVLPPEMGAGVNIERFEREIQLAAKLQHPHIVPLLTAGSQDDLLYYVMPFIEGESLRAKLAREGELPLGEAVRILRDVVDALAYAHEHGVVHRDIKPDNVLLTAKHAVVTDFGVAKAVSVSTDEVSLTSLGVALGTPAYMSPEQAAASPQVDHRADLYAVGALAYEMLCGQPPFSGTNAQAILAAHVTQAPEPCTTHRPAVPAALNTLVLRCLEKHAADRWQRAEELAPHLEAMLTPTGGITPTGTQPVLAVDYEAAARASHPVRVAALFGVGSVAVLGLVYLIMIQLGLPDWVFVGAIALLVVALPIALMTGHLERQRALARTTGAAVPTPPAGVHRWLTWRRVVLGGGLAFAGLAVVSAGYMGMRLLGIGPVGTLVAAGVLAERDLLILAEFEDRTPDGNVAASVTEALRVDLSQSPVIRLMDAAAVRQALQRMDREPGAAVDVAVAQEIALRAGGTAVVAGDVGTLGTSYVVSARLLASADGSELLALRETAESDAALVDAVDRLSARLRERIGESLRTIRGTEPLARVTTASLEALRLYSRAQQAAQEGDPAQAIRLLEEAVAADTGFAMAHRKLAVVLTNTFVQQSRINAAATRAYRHRDRLPPLERHLTTAYYYDQVEPDRDRTIDAYRSALEIDPDNSTALNNLAIELNERRDWADAEALLRRAIAAAPIYQYYVNLLESQVGQGKWAAADSTMMAFEMQMPGHPTVAGMRVFLHAAKRDFETSEREALALAEAGTGGAGFRRVTGLTLVMLQLVRGRLAAAERYAAAAQAVCEAEGDLACALAYALEPAMDEAVFRAAPDAAVRWVDEVLARYPLEEMDPVDRPYRRIALVYATVGRADRARRLRTQWEHALDESQRPADERFRWDGMIAMGEGRYRDAIASYRAYYSEVGCNVCGLHQLGRAYDSAGQADSALAVYERAVTLPDARNLIYEAPWLGSTYRRLGELYEARADREKALEYYDKFVELWNDADPELQPLVEDVRDRIARLAGEPLGGE
jgi:tetratricopeptide (TPR) repeat protein